MIDIEKVKLILWNLEDSACFDCNYKSEDVIKDGINLFDICTVNKDIQEFMYLSKSCRIRQGIISTAFGCVWLLRNNHLVQRYEVGIESHTLNELSFKLGMIKALQEIRGYKSGEILLVDTVKDDVSELDDGFQLCTPTEISTFVQYFSNECSVLNLTKRQNQIVEILKRDGFTNSWAIGNELGITEGTVKEHVRALKKIFPNNIEVTPGWRIHPGVSWSMTQSELNLLNQRFQSFFYNRR